MLQKGRCLNVAPDFSAAAEECLSRAVKLQPGLVEGWNTLGEQYWKKGDLIGAKNCFTGALQQVMMEKGRFVLFGLLSSHIPYLQTLLLLPGYSIFFFPPQFIPGISCNSNFIMNDYYTHINTFSVYVMWPKFPVTGETISTFLIIEPKPGNTKSTSNWFVFSWSLLRQTDLLDYYIILAHYLHSCWSDALIATIVSYLNNLFSSLDVCDG